MKRMEVAFVYTVFCS